MEESNLSVSMAVDTDLEESSLLNQNVSLGNSMELTLSPLAGKRSLSPSLSFSLSEAEQLKLKQRLANVNSVKAIANEHNQQETNETMDSSVDMECSTFEDSERVISIDDTLDEAPRADTTTAEEASLDLTEEPEQATHDLTEETAKETTQATVEEEEISIATVTPTVRLFEHQLVELGRRCWASTAQAQQYTKGCYWSPDGTCLLLPVHKDGMHVMELPLDLYEVSSVSTERGLSQLNSAVHVPEGGTVYDCVWYPLMNSQQPDTCFWLATRQHEPIHMWDAFDGRLRCSYSGYDEVDEVVAAISLGFSQDGQKIYAGYKRCIKIFDTIRPGRVYDEYAVKSAISCIAQTSEHPHTVTCGNWRGYIQHFDLRSPPKQGPLFTLGGHTAGITQLRYAPDAAGSWQLFSGARKCSKLLQWDMRNYKQPLHVYQRAVNTNQRIQFDLSPSMSWLVSGDTDGALNVWSLEEERTQAEQEAMKLALHGDCCNGISFHPTLPILASSSGQYHFLEGDAHDTINTTDVDASLQQLEAKSVIDYENAVLLLWCGESQDSFSS